MKLSDQIALVTQTLDDFGGVTDGESAGEAAVRVLREMRLRVTELETAAAASAEGLCDSCGHFKAEGLVPRLCQNPEAFRAGHAKRGHSVSASHGCELWARAAADMRPPAWRGQGLVCV